MIDISKEKSMVVICPLGKLVEKPFEVHHISSELSELARLLKSLKSETKVIREHTGCYYELVAQMPHNDDIFVSAVNLTAH